MTLRLEIKDVELTFRDGRNSVPVLKNLTLDTQGYSRIGIVGVSGIGKTSLFRILAGLERRWAGEILLDGSHVGGRVRVGYAFQDRRLFPWLSVRENTHLANLKLTRAEVDVLLRRFEISHLAQRLPGNLSGGEAARCTIARSLAGNPELLLLDEPFNGLDYPTRSMIMADLHHEQMERSLLVLLITHDVDEAMDFCDLIAILRGPPALVHKLIAIRGKSEMEKLELALAIRSMLVQARCPNPAES